MSDEKHTKWPSCLPHCPPESRRLPVEEKSHGPAQETVPLPHDDETGPVAWIVTGGYLIAAFAAILALYAVLRRLGLWDVYMGRYG